MSGYTYERQWYTTEQRYRRVPTNSVEQKEPKTRPIKRPSLRGSEPRTSTNHRRQRAHSPSTFSSPTSAANIDRITPLWKQRVRHAGIAVVILVVLVVICILITALVTIAEKLRAIAAISTSCPTA
ncbi:hypothetical protein DL93DRAFT_2102420 [Clavulina sp. PMI_390]|nr:hypothetical protein DL93DRAFT_2102420 [Clavulina sp. PMI_390]